MQKNTSWYSLVYILFLLVFWCSCNDQSPKKDNDAYIEKLSKLIDDNLLKDANLANNYAKELILYATKNNDTNLLIAGYLKQGKALINVGKHKEAIAALETGFGYTNENVASNTKYDYLLRIGNAYVLYNDDENALRYYTKVYEAAVKENNKKVEILAYTNMAKVTRNIGKFEEALHIYKDVLVKAKKLNVKKANLARIYMGIGGTYLTLKEPDSALYYSNIGIKISQEINDKIGESYFYNDLGIAYFLKEDYKQALDNFKVSKQFIDLVNDDKRMAESYFHIGHSYFKLKEYTKAITNLEEVILIVNESEKIAEVSFKPLQLLDTYDLLSKAYKILGNEEQAELFEKIKNDLDRIIDKKAYKIKEALFESEIRTKDILIEKIQGSNAKNRTLLYIALLLCLIATIIILYYRKKVLVNKAKFDKLIEEQEKEKVVTTSKKNLSINDEKIVEILRQLDKLEQKEYYLDANCTLANMAKKAKTNTTYLTKILKEHKASSFYEYINGLRIQYAISRLKNDNQFRKYSIKSIAKEVGYKSPESFTKHFKKTTGIYPSYFIQQLQKQ